MSDWNRTTSGMTTAAGEKVSVSVSPGAGGVVTIERKAPISLAAMERGALALLAAINMTEEEYEKTSAGTYRRVAEKPAASTEAKEEAAKEKAKDVTAEKAAADAARKAEAAKKKADAEAKAKKEAEAKKAAEAAEPDLGEEEPAQQALFSEEDDDFATNPILLELTDAVAALPTLRMLATHVKENVPDRATFIATLNDWAKGGKVKVLNELAKAGADDLAARFERAAIQLYPES